MTGDLIDTSVSKGTKRLVEIEYLEDEEIDSVMRSLVKGEPIKSTSVKVNTIYFQNISQIKEDLKKAVIEFVDKI